MPAPRPFFLKIGSIAVFLSLFLTSLIAFSDGIPSVPQGIYLGVSAIKDTGYYPFSRSDFNAPLSFVDQDISVLSGRGFGGEVYLGYKYPLQRFSIALEGFYNSSSHLAEFNLLDSNALYTRQLTGSFQQKWLAGAALLPGFYISPQSLFYGRVGWLMSEVTLNGVITQIGNGSYGSFSGNLNRPVDLQGLQLGLGMELEIRPRLNIRLEWDWNRVQNYVFNNIVRDSIGNPFAIFRTATHPTLEQIKLGVNWCFGG